MTPCDLLDLSVFPTQQIMTSGTSQLEAELLDFEQD